MADVSLPATPTTACARPAAPWAAVVRTLGDRLVALQRPIRVLDSVKWDEAAERAFFAGGARALPPIDREFYAARPLPFDPAAKQQELRDLEGDVRRLLGRAHPAGRILLRMCREYRDVVELLLARGTSRFAALSRRLYGTSLGRGGLSRILGGPVRLLGHSAGGGAFEPEDRSLGAAEVVPLLTGRLRAYFGSGAGMRVRLSDGIVADAAAGCSYLKIRRDAVFGPRDVRVLEVHEGWVHLGTTLNGQGQPACTFLARGTPSSATTQEGLAVLTELLAGALHPERWRRLADRAAAVVRAEAGADFLDVYRYLLERGHGPADSYRQAARVFRGALPAGTGPFTKDLAYGRGVVAVARFVERARASGESGLVPLLFCGKTRLEDVPLLRQLLDDGLLALPRIIPPPFAELAAPSGKAASGGREAAGGGR